MNVHEHWQIPGEVRMKAVQLPAYQCAPSYNYHMPFVTAWYRLDNYYKFNERYNMEKQGLDTYIRNRQ